MSECYLSVFCKFKNREEQEQWMRDHVIGQSIPCGGPVFSYSADNESEYRDKLIKVSDFLKSKGSINAFGEGYSINQNDHDYLISAIGET